MEYKKYKKLDFNSIYKAKKYPKKMWPILNEYFSRYKHEFELTDDEIKWKLDVLVNNLDSINFDFSGKNRYNGVYYYYEKKIDININEQTMNKEELLNVIFHELNHALENNNSPDSTSFKKYDYQNNIWQGTALNEIITEMKASRLSKNDRTDLSKKTGNSRMFLDLNGYGDLIFIGTMIHTALGISEKEFLKYADKGEQFFEQMIKPRFPSDEEYNIFMKNITFHSDMLHTIKYNRENLNKPYTEEEMYNLNNSISGIYDNCLYAMGKIMTHNAFINRNDMDMKEYMTKCRFNLEKLNINFKHGISYLYFDKEFDTSENPYLLDLQDKILVLESIGEAKNSLSDFEYSELLSNFYNKNLNSSEYLNTLKSSYGIGLDMDSTSFERTMDLAYEIKILNEEYGQESWNNGVVLEEVQHLLEQDNKIYKKENLFKKIIDKIKNFRQRNLYKALPEANINSSSTCNYETKKSSEIDKLKDLVVENPNYGENIRREEKTKKIEER